jgi:enolase
MPKIEKLSAKEILDSRGNPTLEVSCFLEGGFMSVASVPSGKSVGAHEAFELRDGDMARYNGMGVLKALNNVETIILNGVKGQDLDQRSLDNLLIKLDGTQNKSNLGANAILGVSLAFARAVAMTNGMELYQYAGSLIKSENFVMPNPSFNIINGGKHSDSGLDIQEFMIIPVGVKGFRKKIQAGAEVIAKLRDILTARGYSTSVGDEGGFAPNLKSNEEAIELIIEAVSTAGYVNGEVKIGLDVAASSFFKDGAYNLKISGISKVLNTDELIAWYSNLTEKYPIISIEDGLSEDDWEGFSKMNRLLGEKIMIVGDDLLTTNVERIKNAIEKKGCKRSSH